MQYEVGGALTLSLSLFLPFVPHLLQCLLQQSLSLLALQQEAIPAAIERIQLLPQEAGLVAGPGLQQLGAGSVDRLHGGAMRQDVISQHLRQ